MVGLSWPGNINMLKSKPSDICMLVAITIRGKGAVTAREHTNVIASEHALFAMYKSRTHRQ